MFVVVAAVLVFSSLTAQAQMLQTLVQPAVYDGQEAQEVPRQTRRLLRSAVAVEGTPRRFRSRVFREAQPLEPRLFRASGRFHKRVQSATTHDIGDLPLPQDSIQIVAYSYDAQKHHEKKMTDEDKLTNAEAVEYARGMERTTMAVKTRRERLPQPPTTPIPATTSTPNLIQQLPTPGAERWPEFKQPPPAFAQKPVGFTPSPPLNAGPPPVVAKSPPQLPPNPLFAPLSIGAPPLNAAPNLQPPNPLAPPVLPSPQPDNFGQVNSQPNQQFQPQNQLANGNPIQQPNNVFVGQPPPTAPIGVVQQPPPPPPQVHQSQLNGDQVVHVHGQAANSSLEQLGCGFDWLTNQCKDVFNLGWCGKCHDFGNVFLHDCKCVAPLIRLPPPPAPRPTSFLWV